MTSLLRHNIKGYLTFKFYLRYIKKWRQNKTWQKLVNLQRNVYLHFVEDRGFKSTMGLYCQINWLRMRSLLPCRFQRIKSILSFLGDLLKPVPRTALKLWSLIPDHILVSPVPHNPLVRCGRLENLYYVIPKIVRYFINSFPYFPGFTEKRSRIQSLCYPWFWWRRLKYDVIIGMIEQWWRHNESKLSSVKK